MVSGAADEVVTVDTTEDSNLELVKSDVAGGDGVKVSGAVDVAVEVGAVVEKMTGASVFVVGSVIVSGVWVLRGPAVVVAVD